MKIGQYDLYSIETSEFSLDGGCDVWYYPKNFMERKIIA